MEPLLEQWEANLFGRFRIRCGERSADHFQTRQTALLFAYLLTFSRLHSRDEVISLLWPDADSDSGRRRLSQAIWRIRQTLSDLGSGPDSRREIVIADRNTVAVDPEQIASDVARFRQYCHRAGKADGAERVRALEQAVALYGNSGGFLSGFYDDWVVSERQKLLTEYIAALEALGSYFEKRSDWQQSLALAETAVAADPLREVSHYHLIRLLTASGQAAAAQRQYDSLARLLARELNTEPSGTTRALIAQVHQNAGVLPSPLAVEPSASPRSLSLLQVAPLPAPLTTFFGRENFLREVGALLDDPAIRLITLLGTGGVGKTRLALELARSVAARRVAPAVALVTLADVAEPRLIAESIADALTALREAPPLQRIVTALTTALEAPPFLLVLDNAEHMAEQVGTIIAELLARVPRLRVLVTSQRSLGISGEHEVMLTPLELPRSGRDTSPVVSSALPATGDGDIESAPSVRLFVDRAKSVRPGFPTDTASLAEVALICERLEGLPLAIELCAGWAQTLGTRQMREMLARRFELLVSRRTDIPVRHRTLRAALEYSYVQLEEGIQEFFVQLSVFRSGWTLAAAADVCTNGSVPAALAMLAQMRERSLIVADEDRIGDGMRYRMLESLRDFAAEQRTMTQIREHDRAHALYFGRFVQEIASRIQGAKNTLWLKRLSDETENIRAALEYLTSRRETADKEQAWVVTVAVARVWKDCGSVRDTHEWLTRALAMDDFFADHAPTHIEPEPEHLQRLRAELLAVQAQTLHTLSEYAESDASAEQALAIWQALDYTTGMAECVNIMGINALIRNDFDRARPLLIEALALARKLGNLRTVANVLNDIGRVALALEDWQTARDRFGESLAISRPLGSHSSVCSYLNNLSLVARYQGRYAEARELLQEASSLRREHNLTSFSVNDLNLAAVERLDGCYAESLRLLSSTIASTLAYGERRVIAWCVKEMGHLAVAVGQYALGLRLLSCAEALCASIGMSFKPMGPRDIEQDRFAGENALGAAEAAKNWSLGAAADPETLLAQAQAECATALASLLLPNGEREKSSSAKKKAQN